MRSTIVDVAHLWDVDHLGHVLPEQRHEGPLQNMIQVRKLGGVYAEINDRLWIHVLEAGQCFFL